MDEEEREVFFEASNYPALSGVLGEQGFQELVLLIANVVGEFSGIEITQTVQDAD